MRWKGSRAAPLLLVAALWSMAGCAPTSSTNNEQVIDNAMGADAAVTEAADDRADALEDQAEQYLAEANMTHGNAAAGLRAEAADDLRAAGSVRREGQAEGAAAEEKIENGAGLLNSN